MESIQTGCISQLENKKIFIDAQAYSLSSGRIGFIAFYFSKMVLWLLLGSMAVIPPRYSKLADPIVLQLIKIHVGRKKSG